ncbi:MAG: redoxin family protein [Verrucomicrobia bacterium]|nr:redoxin family protein [Verrucomicrobiota bacterium]
MAFTGSLLAEALTVERVAADPRLWPKQVITKAPANITVLVNGQPSGTMQLPAGQIARLVRVEGSIVHLEINRSPFTLPASETDLLAGAATQLARLQQPAPAASNLPPRPAATTAPAAPAPGQKVVPFGAKEGPGTAQNTLGASLKNDLVSFKNNAVTFQKGDDLAGKRYVALYFSAHWCGPCRQFTPKLVQWYQQHRDKADQFEIVFVSSDTSAAMQSQYMKEDKMPWPAVDWGRTGTTKRLKDQYGGKGIPCLVIVDEAGQVVSHSYVNGQFVGPQKVLQDLEKLLTKKS